MGCLQLILFPKHFCLPKHGPANHWLDRRLRLSAQENGLLGQALYLLKLSRPDHMKGRFSYQADSLSDIAFRLSGQSCLQANLDGFFGIIDRRRIGRKDLACCEMGMKRGTVVCLKFCLSLLTEIKSRFSFFIITSDKGLKGDRFCEKIF